MLVQHLSNLPSIVHGILPLRMRINHNRLQNIQTLRYQGHFATIDETGIDAEYLFAFDWRDEQ